MTTKSSNSDKPHIAMLPSPGMGHITPLFELAKRLVTHHGLCVSFLVVPSQSSTAQNDLLRSTSVPSDLHVIDLQAIDIRHLITDDMPALTRICVMLQGHFSQLKSVLMGLNQPKALIVDLFTTDAIEVCEELSIPVYSFYTASAGLLAFSLYLPVLDREVEGEFIDLPGPVQVPGCRAERTEDLLDQVRNRKIDEYKWFLLHMSRLVKVSGIIVNTWDDLELVSLRAIRENQFYQELHIGPVYPVGPLIKQDEPIQESDKLILSWLDKQPADSVLFITLGSGGTLSSQQLAELTQGLELSEQRFILVARRPTGENITSFFNAGNLDENDPKSYLPQGFIERTRGVGLVVREWAPQVSVLRHSATGGFLLHCGWNSTLESILNGVPMIAWPLYAEQKMNATSLAEEIGVAVKPVVNPGTGLVPKEEIEMVVRLVMEGEKGKIMRAKAKELKESAKKGLGPGGSSFKSLSCLVQDILA